jgi:hypothetical protein
MSKLYMLNRMRGAPAAGDFLSLLGKGAKLIGGLFKSKGAKAAAAAAKKALSNPVVQTVLVAGGTAAGMNLMAPGSSTMNGGSGGSGSWTRRRRKGITATELRGFRKVAALLHKEGMSIKKHRRS